MTDMRDWVGEFPQVFLCGLSTGWGRVVAEAGQPGQNSGRGFGQA